MTEPNIEKFNEYVAKIFDELYSQFPEEITIDPKDITGELEKDKHHAFNGTMRFLEREGFIHMNEKSTYTSYYYLNVALSSKGLAVLGASPDSLKENITFIQKIREALKAETKEAVTATINGLISYTIAGFGG
ncbi:hypothetical protein ACFL36_01365 [Thermodesulfobacteriota bacterium]